MAFPFPYADVDAVRRAYDFHNPVLSSIFYHAAAAVLLHEQGFYDPTTAYFARRRRTTSSTRNLRPANLLPRGVPFETVNGITRARLAQENGAFQQG